MTDWLPQVVSVATQGSRVDWIEGAVQACTKRAPGMGGRRARYIYLLPRTVDANDFGGWGVNALNANNYWDRGVGALNITVGMHILLL